MRLLPSVVAVLLACQASATVTGPVRTIVHDFVDHHLDMSPKVYKPALDSVLDGGDIATLRPLLDHEKMVQLVGHEYVKHGRRLPDPLEFSRDVSGRLRKPVVEYLISDEFMEKARAAGRNDLIGALEVELEVPFLKKAVNESDGPRVAEILSRHVKDLDRCITEDGYPANPNALEGVDAWFLEVCNTFLANCTDQAVLEEFFKHPFFAWKVPSMLYYAVIYLKAGLAEYLVSKLSSQFYNQSNASLVKRFDVDSAAHMYRSQLQGAFLMACRLGLVRIATALMELGGMDVKAGFIEATLEQKSDVMDALIHACPARGISWRATLFAALQSYVRQECFTYGVSGVPEHFASYQGLIEFVEQCIAAIKPSIAPRGRAQRGDHETAQGNLVKRLEAILWAVQTYLVAQQ